MSDRDQLLSWIPERVPDRVGTVLDKAYRLTRLIGQGGMASVYEGRQLRLDRRVAIKIMARELSANPEALARFQREARITSRLAHPNIVQASDFGKTPAGEPYLVMEYLDGEDLEQRITRRGRVPLASAVTIVKQIASALAATHGKAIIHRDLKPANIVLMEVEGEADFVKVVDFGISKMKASTRLTRASIMMGTPGYMAPEQARGRPDDIDHRSDQWALACITWEMLAGRRLFPGDDVAAILYQVVNEDPPLLAPVVPGLPSEIDSVLRRALAKQPGDRFPTVTAFARAFAAAAAPQATPALTPPPVVVDRGPRRTPARSRAPAPTTMLRRDWRGVLLFWRRRQPRRKPGVVGYTMALGQRAIEGLLPSRRKQPWWRRAPSAKARPTGARIRWLSLLGLGAAAVIGGLLFLRAAHAPPARALPPAPTAVTPAPGSAPKPGPVTRGKAKLSLPARRN